ncbi:MAG TPA: PucR family transcriptional regulator ligand-binding domain-containing protein [Solirubrobacteraceae bacterium]|nr:PucR family transcriptional regulator ligand-binding domain-containing protein [Solirubrobacteraceae bacterium]
MLTVAALLDELGLRLLEPEAGASAPVRWVHSTELLDPTPWLRGGELLLTTGIQLDAPARQREFVDRLVDHGIAALGVGTGLTHAELPPAIVDAARRRGLPLFEVPYELPFIAITERASAHLVNEQYDALRRSTEIQDRLERLVLDERGLDAVMRVVADTIGGDAGVLDPGGDAAAWEGAEGELPAGDRAALHDAVRRLRAGDEAEPLLGGRALILPVEARRGVPAQAWLVGVAGVELGDFERLILRQAVTVVALELMRVRVARDTERRLAGDVLAEALTGRLHPEELATRLRPFGIGDRVAVIAFTCADPDGAEPVLERALAAAGVRALLAIRGPLLCAVIDAAAGDPIEIARAARAELADAVGEVRAGASRAADAQSLRRSFHEARCALEAVRMSNGHTPEVASYADLGSYQLLLSLHDDEALRSYCDSVLAAVDEADPAYGDELLRSLDAYLDSNGHWERAASRVPCHRHTLRYRIRRIEELTGRDLGNSRDRIDFWLALRGRELTL